MRFPRWFALVTLPIAFLLAHVAAPWGISLLATRHGWQDGRPGAWNLLAILLVALGIGGIAWGTGMHVARIPGRVAFQTTPTFLLRAGPYRFSRNPMYVAVVTLWLGWALFYGSGSLLLALIVLVAVLTTIVVPFEERRLEERFGEAYRHYSGTVPRWLRRARRRRIP